MASGPRTTTRGPPQRRPDYPPAVCMLSWVTGDSVYGADDALRRSIEKSGRGYVMAVTSRQLLGFKTVANGLEDVPAGGWPRLSAGEGAKGPRLYDWAWLPDESDTAGG